MATDSTEKDGHDSARGTDVTGEFFTVGAPLHAVRAGYVRRRADDQLYSAVMAGHYAHVVAPDRSGKSSLVAATAARLENNGYKVAILDLEQIGDRDGGSDAGRWYYSVAYRLLRQLRIRFDLQEWWQDKSILSNRQRLFEFYAEILLQQVSEPIAIFIDEIQCIEDLPHADQLLTSIRTAHNARATDPDFLRLSFVLLGECDPVSLMEEAEQSPFNVTQHIQLDDFSRSDLGLFATELNLDASQADLALDRIYYWTSGQPYLSQKLARAVARESAIANVEEAVDRIATTQLAGRAAFHSEPHMSHIHRIVTGDARRSEPLLNLYGKIRKGIVVPADLGSPFQRRLMAIGLLVIDAESNLRVRNRLYEQVFTARWANENLPTRLKVPAMIAAATLLLAMIPFWYTQWLPNPYVRTLASDEVAIADAVTAYENLRSFPGHRDTADNVYRRFLERRAAAASSEAVVQEIADLAAALPNAGSMADEFVAGFWDRRVRQAVRSENRDAALLASLRALVLATTPRRQRAASLVSADYPFLLNTLPAIAEGEFVFDAVGMIMTAADGAAISQYSYSPQGVQLRDPWTVTALEVTPLLRRVIVDREGNVNRIGLTLNISHARLSDLRVKVIAPSGRAVEVETGMDRAFSNDDIRIPAAQLDELRGETLSGTWSISVRDENLGVAGQLVGWNLKLNSQGAVEYFQRGLNIPDPVERETDNIWFDSNGRYAVARATQSDSARIWDLAFAEALRAVALPESEVLIGLDASARRLVTASQDSVNLWDTGTGDKVATLPIGAASSTAKLTSDRMHLYVERRGDVDSQLELWNLDDESMAATLVVAGAPASVAIDAAGNRVAIADFDRAVRVWEFAGKTLLGQFDLPAQPGTLALSADGETLGVTYPGSGLSIWSIADPRQPLVEEFGTGQWQLAFSPSGNQVAAGRPESGFQIYSTVSGALVGPPLGVREAGQAADLLAFSYDEQVLLTGDSVKSPRIWRVPGASLPTAADAQSPNHIIWRPSGDSPVAFGPGGRFAAIGDARGHVHIVPAGATVADLAAISDDVSYVGHRSAVRLISISEGGSLVASVAEDNSLRAWNSSNGEPLPYDLVAPGAPVSQIEISPDAGYIALLSGGHLLVVDANSGAVVAEYNSLAPFSGMTFAAEGELYVGDVDGALRVLRRATDSGWNVQQVWQGPSGIRLLRASPRGDYLIVIDRGNRASQFLLAEGRIGDSAMQLPSEVREVGFDSNGTRAYFRTTRWLHRASTSKQGLTWRDAVFLPRALANSGLVAGAGDDDPRARHRLFLPAIKNGFMELLEINFTGTAESGLFGSRDDLLREWQSKIIADSREAS